MDENEAWEGSVWESMAELARPYFASLYTIEEIEAGGAWALCKVGRQVGGVYDSWEEAEAARIAAC